MKVRRSQILTLLTSSCRKSGLMKQSLPCLLWFSMTHRSRLTDV